MGTYAGDLRQRKREEAAKLARQLGDEAWKQGSTKHALEAYEASDITPEELLEMAEKLLKAEAIIEVCETELERTPKTCNGHKGSWIGIWGDPYDESCKKCKPRTEIVDEYLERIFQLLGWEIAKYKFGHYGHGENSNFISGSFYRAAALACLKLIKRM